MWAQILPPHCMSGTLGSRQLPHCCHSFPGAALVMTVVVQHCIIFSSLCHMEIGGDRTVAGCALDSPVLLLDVLVGFGISILPWSDCILGVAANSSWLVGSAMSCGYSGLQWGWQGRDSLLQIGSCLGNKRLDARGGSSD